MRIVGERTDVPVPNVGLFEPTGEVLGTPFFLMDRIDGVVPPDVPPYNWGTAPDNWQLAPTRPPRTSDGCRTTPSGRSPGCTRSRTPADAFDFLDRRGVPGRDPARAQPRVGAGVVRVGHPGPRPLADRRDARSPGSRPTCPTPPAPTRCSAGATARIGNVMFQDFAPVGVLDWEMAAIGPREMDLSWIVFAHMVFESITEVFALPGDAGLHARGGREGDVRRGRPARSSATSPGTTSTTPSSGAWSSCAPGPGRSTSARSSGPTTSRRSSTTSRSWSGCSRRRAPDVDADGRVPDPPAAAADRRRRQQRPQLLRPLLPQRARPDRRHLPHHRPRLLPQPRHEGRLRPHPPRRRADRRAPQRRPRPRPPQPARRQLPGRGRPSPWRSCASSSRRPRASRWTCTGAGCSRSSRSSRT